MRKVIFLLVLWPFILGTASTFNATTSLVEITQTAAINTTTFTAGCWTYRVGTGEAGFGAIMDKNLDADNGWRLYNATGFYTFEAFGTGTDGDWEVTAPAANTWVHVALAYNGSAAANDPTFFFDAAAQALTTDVNPAAAPNAGTQNLALGNRVGSDRTWDGRLADCFYYNRALTANEVKQIMRFGPPSLPSGLIGYWPLGAFEGRNYTATSLTTAATTDLTITGTGPPRSSAQGGM